MVTCLLLNWRVSGSCLGLVFFLSLYRFIPIKIRKNSSHDCPKKKGKMRNSQSPKNDFTFGARSCAAQTMSVHSTHYTTGQIKISGILLILVLQPNQLSFCECFFRDFFFFKIPDFFSKMRKLLGDHQTELVKSLLKIHGNKLSVKEKLEKRPILRAITK